MVCYWILPVSETAFQQGEGLGVDAGMVHRGVVVYTGDGDGEETPVSADVLQALPVVGARDEGAVAGQGEGFGENFSSEKIKLFTGKSPFY